MTTSDNPPKFGTKLSKAQMEGRVEGDDRIINRFNKFHDEWVNVEKGVT